MQDNFQWSEIALSNSSYPVCWILPDGRIDKFNEAFIVLCGYSRDELAGQSLFDLDEDLSKKVWKGIWQKLLDLKSQIIERTIDNKSGKAIPVEMNFTLVEDKDVRIGCVVMRDISEQKALGLKLKEANLVLERIMEERSEGSKMTLNALLEKKEVLQKLQDLQRHHESILQSAGEGIYGLDCQGHTTFVNAAAVKMVGYELGEMIG